MEGYTEGVQLDLGFFALELALVRPGRPVHFDVRPAPRRWWLFGPRLTARELRARARSRRMKALAIGPVEVRVRTRGPVPWSGDSPYRLSIYGDGIEALVEGEEWTTTDTRVLWMPFGATGYLTHAPELRMRATKLDDRGIDPDPAIPARELVVHRAAVHTPPKTIPPFPPFGYPASIELPSPGYWRFEAFLPDRTPTLVAFVDEPLVSTGR